MIRLKRLKYFLSLVWRKWDTYPKNGKIKIYRIPWATAWEVVNIRYPRR
jgi:hypothetical protein